MAIDQTLVNRLEKVDNTDYAVSKPKNSPSSGYNPKPQTRVYFSHVGGLVFHVEPVTANGGHRAYAVFDNKGKRYPVFKKGFAVPCSSYKYANATAQELAYSLNVHAPSWINDVGDPTHQKNRTLPYMIREPKKRNVKLNGSIRKLMQALGVTEIEPDTYGE